jgi:cytochrome c biogenesis protein CcdA
METRTGTRVEIRERNTGEPGDFEALVDELDGLGVPMRLLPVMIVGDEVFQGDREIKRGLEDVMSGNMSAEQSKNRGTVRWEPGAVFLAGLLDGVNPCAFSAMVFLVSALAVAGRSRRTMLAVGLFYALGIFITYSLVGAGLLSGIRRIAVSSGMQTWLEMILGIILGLLALLSVIDGVRLSRGRTDLLLKLPKNLSGRVHGIIRHSVRSGAAAGGSFVLGAVVALIELGCTGQVYLPTIAWMISRGEGSRPWFWLAIYNTAFIIPLLIVFGVSYKGVSAVKLAGIFKTKGAAVKYVTAGLFTALAVIVFIA